MKRLKDTMVPKIKQIRMAEFVKLFTRLKEAATKRSYCYALWEDEVINIDNIHISETRIELRFNKSSAVVFVAMESGYDHWLDMTIPQIRTMMKQDFKLLQEIKW